MPNPNIRVMIPTYNQAHLIGREVRSEKVESLPSDAITVADSYFCPRLGIQWRTRSEANGG